jgi:hypothetical protein
VRCTAASIDSAETQRDATPAFSPHRSAVLGLYVVVVARLVQRTENHSTRNGPALAPSRYRFDLEISITWSLARWAPQDRPRDSPTDRRDGSREFSLGCTTHHGELLKLGFNVSQATVSRYMPRRDYPPTQTWRTFLQNQAFGIGTIGLGEAGRLSDELLALVRASIERVVRCVTKVRDGIPSRLMEPSSTLHRLRPYRPSNRTDRGAVHGRCMPVRRWPTTLSVWTVADRRLSPYRSRASPRRKLPAFSILHTIAIARTRQANHNSCKAIVLHVCHEQAAQELMILYAPPLPGDSSASRPSRTRL